MRFIFVLFFITIACAKEKEVSPPPPEKEKVKKISNLRLLITIKGKTTAKPYGDGSGKISVNATATNAQKYTFSFSTGDVIENTTGRTDYTFKHSGKKDYTVSVIATSSTGHSQIMRKKITIHKGYQLIWADEFNTDGKPDTTRWTYDIGTGSNGWGNNEAQYYTDRTTNVTVKDGLLKITAKKESLKGKYYTSARIKTQGKFSFTYGKVEVKAKLPKGVGTWPAIWMLGNSITSVGWPACGEIDIMEHVGKEQNIIHSSLHTTSSFGATTNTHKKKVNAVSETFHIYSVAWDKDKIVFYIDNKEHYRYEPANKNKANYPFNAPQFLILNIAMGGTFGGAITADFKSSSMEVDYIRVYQYKK